GLAAAVAPLRLGDRGGGDLPPVPAPPPPARHAAAVDPDRDARHPRGVLGSDPAPRPQLERPLLRLVSGGVAIVERSEQLDRVPAGFDVVAASPEVEAELAARGRPAVSVADFADERRIQELGAASFETVHRIAAAIDALVRRRVPDERVEPARWDYF